MLYTKGCDLVDAHWPESEIIDYPLTDDEQAEIDKACLLYTSAKDMKEAVRQSVEAGLNVRCTFRSPDEMCIRDRSMISLSGQWASTRSQPLV